MPIMPGQYPPNNNKSASETIFENTSFDVTPNATVLTTKGNSR
jgi:hypothetical protein